MAKKELQTWKPDIDQSVFLISCPQFSKLPKADLDIIIMRTLGASVDVIAKVLNITLADVELILRRHDPDGVLPYQQSIKAGIAKAAASNLAYIILTLISTDELAEMSPLQKVDIAERLLKIAQYIKVELPKQDEAHSALGRLKDAGITVDQ